MYISQEQRRSHFVPKVSGTERHNNSSRNNDNRFLKGLFYTFSPLILIVYFFYCVFFNSTQIMILFQELLESSVLLKNLLGVNSDETDQASCKINLSNSSGKRLRISYPLIAPPQFQSIRIGIRMYGAVLNLNCIKLFLS